MGTAKDGVGRRVVESVKWAAPIVTALNHDGWMCSDFKTTINPVTEMYPIPRIELFARLTGHEKFTKHDLQNAYQQVLLGEVSKAGHHQQTARLVPIHNAAVQCFVSTSSTSVRWKIFCMASTKLHCDKSLFRSQEPIKEHWANVC